MSKRKKPINYLSNDTLLTEIKISQENHAKNPHLNPVQALTPILVEKINLLVENIANKINWRNYSYIDDMKGDAKLALSQNALKFDASRFSNPFGYYTQIVWRCFISSREKEVNVGKIRDLLIEKSTDYLPSYKRQMEDEENQRDLSMGTTYTKTADDERQEAFVKKTILTLNNIIMLFHNTEADPSDIILGISEITGRLSNGQYLFDVESAADLLPDGAEWTLNKNIQADFGVRALLVVDCKNGTKITRGIKHEWADDVIARELTLIALMALKDKLIKENPGVFEKNIRYANVRGVDQTPSENNLASDTKPRRGRKPKAATNG